MESRNTRIQRTKITRVIELGADVIRLENFIKPWRVRSEFSGKHRVYSYRVIAIGVFINPRRFMPDVASKSATE